MTVAPSLQIGLEEVLLVRLVLVVEVLEYWVKVLQDHRLLVLVMVDLVVLLDHLEIQIMVPQVDCMVEVAVAEMEMQDQSLLVVMEHKVS